MTRSQRYRRWLETPEWRTTRSEVLRRDGYRCQCCGLADNRNDVHHTYYPANIAKMPLEALVTLCRDCHNWIEALCLPAQVANRREGWKRFVAARSLLPQCRDWRSERVLGRAK